MTIALLLAAALALWLHKRGELVPNLARLLGTGAGALVTIRLLESGRILPAVFAGGFAYAWWRFYRPGDAVGQARRLLGVDDGADAATIQSAWRTQMATAHPDAGGSNSAAQALTEARDLLLAKRRRTG